MPDLTFPEARHVPGGDAPLQVLLVDDDPTDLELAAIVFGEHDLTLRTFGTGAAALTHLHAADPLPDVVVLDVNMPHLSGFEVLSAIRSEQRLRHLPVVMLSTSGEDRDVSRAYDLLASSYLVKERDFLAFEQQVQGFVQFWNTCLFPGRRTD
ncbi:response regulator [Deinococcus sp. 6GRE01]|uniref:response regulator n=1 Tax=Deinococcus sp. 6GRE01 TaxID=2745873 RepID=UPI001E2E3550|nr:response regulator [Deinococcus sp. 6GRE01]